jgi:putative addiction module component (TIGR02574 family)
MTTMEKKVFEKALSLPVEARVELVDQLLGSLNLPTQEKIDQLWAREAERRVSEIEGSKVRLVPGERVFAKIRGKYRR